MPARPPWRPPTPIFTVAAGGGVRTGPGRGFSFAAADAAAGNERMATMASRDESRFTGGTLLPEKYDSVVQRVQQDPRHDRAGLLVEQAEDEAEEHQRRHGADADGGVEAAEDEAGDERGGNPGQSPAQAAEEHAAEADL